MNKWYRNIVFLVFILLCSCSEWLDINHDPNNPSEMDFELVMPSGISSVAYVLGGRYQVLGALWSQHWTQSPGASQYSGIDSYDINSSSFDDRQYGELYTGALKAFEYVKINAQKDEEWNYYFIAAIMQVYTFQLLADLYDEIPFSEALKGDELNLSPHFEKGQDIYDSLIARIDDALSKDLDKEDLLEPEANDLIFQGDMDLWVKFANTLKLKIYLRQSEVRPAIARQGIEKLYQEKVKFLTTDACMLAFQDESGRRNPLYETEMVFFGGNPNLILSRTLHSYMENNSDYERLDNMFYTPDDGGGHKSLIQGDYKAPDEPSGINSSSYSKPLMLAEAPVYIMSYSESCFLQAEAIIRYGVAEYPDAKELYEKGVESAFIRLLYPSKSLTNITEQALTFARGPYKFPAEGSPLESFIKRIITQKWVCLANIQSLETFFEWNRTHYPEISTFSPDDDDYVPGEFTISVNNVTSGRFPKRLMLPESEISGNPNVPERKSVWENIWWNVKPEIE